MFLLDGAIEASHFFRETFFYFSGHTQAWGPGVPNLLSPCFDENGNADGTFGPIDPTNEDNFVFIEQFFREVANVFPDKYVHLGGDEVSYDCW